jgi:hypothetical protein
MVLRWLADTGKGILQWGTGDFNVEGYERELYPVFGSQSIYVDSPIDAFRHAGTSGWMALNAGGEPSARFFGSLNESINGSSNMMASNNVMDEYNNYVGRSAIYPDGFIVSCHIP